MTEIEQLKAEWQRLYDIEQKARDKRIAAEKRLMGIKIKQYAKDQATKGYGIGAILRTNRGVFAVSGFDSEWNTPISTYVNVKKDGSIGKQKRHLYGGNETLITPSYDIGKYGE